MGNSSSNIAILGALASNLAVAATKFIAAYFTRSSAMVSEGIHSLVDAANTLLILIGSKRSTKLPTAKHPFGYGKEIYFWTLVVSISLFAIGGGMAIYEGIEHMLHPEPLQDAFWNYIVLGFSLVFTAISWVLAFKEFSKTKGEKSLLKAITDSKDPGVFAILFEDTADLLGLVIAFIGVYLGHKLNNPYIDGASSVLIGLILAFTSFMLAYESKGLLIGESADPLMIENIRKIALLEPSVEMVKTPVTMHMGPQDIILALGVSFKKELNAESVAEAIDRIEVSIRTIYPEVKKIYIEAKSLTYFMSGNESVKL